MKQDMLGKDGCCLICEECGDCRNPCPSCVCSKCDWYFKNVRGRKCGYIRFKKSKIEMGGIGISNETEKAVELWDTVYGYAWFPRSQITILDNGNVMIPPWLLEEKGWIKDNDWDVLGGKTIQEYENERWQASFLSRL